MADMKRKLIILLLIPLLLAAAVFLALFIYRKLHRDYVKRWEEGRDRILPGIVCVGDSLTAGADSDHPPYPAILGERIDREICPLPVINLGHGGEDSVTILTQAGGIPLRVGSFMIPEECIPVPVSLYPVDGKPFKLVGEETDALLNPCHIADIEGYLTRDPEDRFYFRRMTSGEPVLAREGERVIPNAEGKYPSHIWIIFAGANGGFDSPGNLIDQQKALLGTLEEGNRRYLILTGTGGDADSNREVEEACAAEYGEKYFNLREYLASDGLADAGITPTEQDLRDMEAGRVPESLRQDGIHYNEAGTAVVADRIYEVLDALGYFEELKDYAEEHPPWRSLR